ncbi:MAG: Bug family tripartite tricarboxylate transporter substrate binding protein [Xanthobacteraceae bacterium]
MTRYLPLIAVCLVMAVFSPSAVAEQFPDRPLRMLVGFTPGGAPDITARIFADWLSGALGHAVVVENRPGANGNVAAEAVAKAPADGYTMLLGNDTMLVVNPHLYKTAFDPLKDLAPIASTVSNQFYISINPSLPVHDFGALIRYAQAASPPLAYGSAGNGSMHHLSMEMLKQYAGIELLHVPYRGGSAAANGVLTGEVQVMSSGGSSTSLIESGRLRGLATTGPRRSPLFPNLPAVAEFYPGYEAMIWLGLFAPAATPPAILGKLRGEVNRALADHEVIKRLQSSGLDPFSSEPEQFAALIRTDYEKYGKLIRAIGLKPN